MVILTLEIRLTRMADIIMILALRNAGSNSLQKFLKTAHPTSFRVSRSMITA